MRPFGALHALAVLCGYFAAQVIGGGLLAAFAAPFAEPLSAERLRELAGPAALLGMLFGGAFLAWVARAVAHRELRDRSESGIAWVLGDAPGLVVACSCGALVAGITFATNVYLFPPEPGQPLGPMTELSLTPGSPRIYLALIALLLAPVLEELLFRGMLLAGLTHSWGRIPGALVTTGLFIAVHAIEFLFYWPGTLGLSALALLTLWLRVRYRALGAPILAHFTYNATLLSVSALT